MKQTILMTGASGKLGQAMVRELLARGDSVIATVRNSTRAREFEKNFCEAATSGSLVTIIADLGKADAAERIARALDRRGLKPTAFVHNARDAANLKLSEGNLPHQRQWMREFWIDCGVGSNLAVRLAMGGGSNLKRVVLISSIYGVVAARDEIYQNPGIDSPIHYSVAKAGVVHLAKELAVRLRRRGVAVNCLSYGGVAGRAPAAFRKRYAKHAMTGKMLEESEVAGSLLFLLSDQAKGMTGHNLLVDGGWTAW